jgi:DNA polymerase-3 subunit beta
MEIQVERLREALKLVQPVVPKKPTLVVLKSVLLGDGKVVATDLETMVAVDLPEVDTSCLIPHHAVLELLKYVPGYETLSLKVNKRSIHLAWDSGSATYDTPETADYPSLPTVEAKVEGAVDGDLLVKALVSMLHYCSTDEARPVLNGVAISLGETTDVAGADGFRLAYQTLPVSFPSQEAIIVPAHAVPILEHLWDKSPAPLPPSDTFISQIIGKRQIELTLGNGNLSAHFGRITLLIKLIQGTFPNYKQLIPSEIPLTVQAFATDLERAVHRLKDIADDSKGIVRITWDDTAMTLAAKSEERGKVEAKITVRAEGGKGKTAVQLNDLLDYLKGKDGTITIAVKDEKSPILFRHDRSPLVVMMPLMVQW